MRSQGTCIKTDPNDLISDYQVLIMRIVKIEPEDNLSVSCHDSIIRYFRPEQLPLPKQYELYGTLCRSSRWKV